VQRWLLRCEGVYDSEYCRRAGKANTFIWSVNRESKTLKATAAIDLQISLMYRVLDISFTAFDSRVTFPCRMAIGDLKDISIIADNVQISALVMDQYQLRSRISGKACE
jgi:hypothetical protein